MVLMGTLPAQAAATPSPPSLPSPATVGVAQALPPQNYLTFTTQKFIYMDDGVGLGATITYPSLDGKNIAPGRFPTVLEMTPYGRDGACSCDSATDFATRGYVFVVVDIRGTGGS